MDQLGVRGAHRDDLDDDNRQDREHADECEHLATVRQRPAELRAHQDSLTPRAANIRRRARCGSASFRRRRACAEGRTRRSPPLLDRRRSRSPSARWRLATAVKSVAKGRAFRGASVRAGLRCNRRSAPRRTRAGPQRGRPWGRRSLPQARVARSLCRGNRELEGDQPFMPVSAQSSDNAPDKNRTCARGLGTRL